MKSLIIALSTLSAGWAFRPSILKTFQQLLRNGYEKQFVIYNLVNFDDATNINEVKVKTDADTKGGDSSAKISYNMRQKARLHLKSHS